MKMVSTVVSRLGLVLALLDPDKSRPKGHLFTQQIVTQMLFFRNCIKCGKHRNEKDSTTLQEQIRECKSEDRHLDECKFSSVQSLSHVQLFATS